MHDKILAQLHGIPRATFNKNKKLPLVEKLKLPAIECICALLTYKGKQNDKRRIK